MADTNSFTPGVIPSGEHAALTPAGAPLAAAIARIARRRKRRIVTRP